MSDTGVLNRTEIGEASKQRRDKYPWKLVGVISATLLVGVLSWLFLSPTMAIAAALAVFCIGLWSTAALPEYWPALAFFLIASVLSVAPEQVVFSGFESSAFWLLFSGIVLGASISYTGLGRRSAIFLSKMLGDQYVSVLSGIVCFGVGLAFIMPSAMGRVALLIPITLALADQMGYEPGRNGRAGMLTAAAFGTCLPAFSILPANGPNMILAGMAEGLYGIHLPYWDYLLLHFPVLGLLKSVFLVLLILWVFPDRAPIVRSVPLKPEPMNGSERRLTTLLAICLLFWFTDSVHHISPGWIGLAAALFCLWPGAGLTSKNCLNEDIKYGPLFFVAAIMGLGAVISDTGLGSVIVDGLSNRAGFSPDTPYWNITALTLISTLVGAVTNLPGVPAIMTPIASDLAAFTGLSLSAVLMTQVLAFSSVLLPFQAPPLVAAIQLGNLPVGKVTKLCLMMFVVSIFVLIPLDLLWWMILGIL